MKKRQGSAESLLTEEQKQTLAHFYRDKKLPLRKIAAITGVPVTTVRRVLKSQGIKLIGSPHVIQTGKLSRRG